MTVDSSSALRRDLDADVRGRVHVPGDPSWDEARAAWNLAVDQHPAAVVEVVDADDVVRVVRCARRIGLPVVAQATGHAATDRGADGALLIRMIALNAVEIDVDRRIARAGGGAMWGDVLDQLDGTGLLALSGTAPGVSVVGYTLGGGLSWFSRQHGLASGAVRSIDLVTPDAELITVTATSDPELFWALRGFGGEFGVVTAMEFELFDSPGVVGARLLFPATDAASVLDAFSRLTRSAPHSLAADATVLNFPNVEFLPECRRGRSFVAVNAAHLGSEAECGHLLRDVAAAGTPVEHVIAPVKTSELGIIADDPVDPSPGVDRGTLLRDFDSAAVERLLTAVQPGSPLLAVNIRHLGGALAEPRCGHGGVAGAIDEPYLMFAVGVPGLGGTIDELTSAHDDLRASLGESATDRAPYNFLGRSGTERAYDGATLERLRDLKARRDPHGAFRMTRSLL